MMEEKITLRWEHPEAIRWTFGYETVQINWRHKDLGIRKERGGRERETKW